jgi:AcrR family transcriptional regulator
MAKRAAGEQEKEARRGDILARADELFKEKSFDEIKMAELATELGLAKGTLYLYFPSKELLFLELLKDRLARAFAALRESLGAGVGAATVESISAALAAAMAADPALPRLLAELHPLLERRVPFDQALAYKRELAESLCGIGAAVAAALPPLSPEEGSRFFLVLYALIVGLADLTDLSPFMRKVAAQEGLELYKLGFEDALKESARSVLAGIMEGARCRAEGVAL